MLLKVASDQYYSIRDQMMKLKSYFPSGLIKHFEVGDDDGGDDGGCGDDGDGMRCSWNLQ